MVLPVREHIGQGDDDVGPGGCPFVDLDRGLEGGQFRHGERGDRRTGEDGLDEGGRGRVSYTEEIPELTEGKPGGICGVETHQSAVTNRGRSFFQPHFTGPGPDTSQPRNGTVLLRHPSLRGTGRTSYRTFQ